jgi:hypothetical protein
VLRVIIFAVFSLGCERHKGETPPPPGPSDATQLDARIVDPDREARVAALERLYLHVTTTKRTRSEVEAPEENTLGYIDYLFACGFARLGEASRTRDLLTSATKRLAKVSRDPVHAMLAAAFSAQVSNALAGQPPTSALPPSEDAQLAMLDRVGRYKVDRLREASRILNSGETVDAIGAFANRRKDDRGVGFDRLRGLIDQEARAKVLVELLAELPSVHASDRRLHVAGVIEEASRLPTDRGKHVLGLAVAAIGLVPESERVSVYLRAIELAKKIEPSRVGPLIVALKPTLEDVEWRNPYFEVLPRGFGKDFVDVWNLIEPHALHPDASPIVKAYFAASLVTNSDPRGNRLILELEGVVEKATHMTEQLQLMRALAHGYRHLPVEDGIAAVERLARSQFSKMTDAFGTNSHFALHPLQFTDILVLGIVGD